MASTPRHWPLCSKKLGSEHPYAATAYHNMATVYKAKKDLVKAKEYWAKAHVIRIKMLGNNHPDTQKTKFELDE